ncbi:MAG: ATP-binding protein [Planctomycetes bacterium]|nr:ATP-binding protein [Planctomycetota bacterium]
MSCSIGFGIVSASIIGLIHESESDSRRVADLRAAAERGEAFVDRSLEELENRARIATTIVRHRSDRGASFAMHELRANMPGVWILLAGAQGVPAASSREQSAPLNIMGFDGARAAYQGRLGRGLWVFPDSAWLIAAAPITEDGNVSGVVVIGRRVDESYARDLERVAGMSVWLSVGQLVFASDVGRSDVQSSVVAKIGSSDLRDASQSASSIYELEDRSLVLAAGFVGAGGRAGYCLVSSDSVLVLPWWRFAFLGVLGVVAGLVNWHRFAGGLIRFLDRLVYGLTEAGEGRLDAEFDMVEEKALVEVTSSYKRMQRELRRRLDGLTRAAVRNEEAMQAKDKFLASISHELRTPLTSVCAYAELLLQFSGESRSDEENEFLRIIQGESQRLTRLIDDVLDLTKIEASTLTWNITDFDLADVVREVIDSYASKIVFKSIKVEFTTDSDACPYRGDKRRIAQAIGELLDNAIKFSPVRGRVRVELTQRLTMLELRVTDSGPGIDDDREKEAIFEKFYQRGEVLTDRPDGTGLGLALTRGIVDAHAGTVHCEDSVGGGACFVMRIAKAGECHRVVDEATDTESALVEAFAHWG